MAEATGRSVNLQRVGSHRPGRPRAPSRRSGRVIGPNGVGNSTWCALLAGQQEPNDGRVRVKDGARHRADDEVRDCRRNLERTRLEVVRGARRRVNGRDDAVRRICALGPTKTTAKPRSATFRRVRACACTCCAVACKGPDRLAARRAPRTTSTPSAEVFQTEMGGGVHGGVVIPRHARPLLMETFATRIVELTNRKGNARDGARGHRGIRGVMHVSTGSIPLHEAQKHLARSGVARS